MNGLALAQNKTANPALAFVARRTRTSDSKIAISQNNAFLSLSAALRHLLHTDSWPNRMHHHFCCTFCAQVCHGYPADLCCRCTAVQLEVVQDVKKSGKCVQHGSLDMSRLNIPTVSFQSEVADPNRGTPSSIGIFGALIVYCECRTFDDHVSATLPRYPRIAYFPLG